MTTSSDSNPSLRISRHKDTPPYLICHITVPGGRLHHVAGRGFVAHSPDEATRHSAGPEVRALNLDGDVQPSGYVQCTAPLFVTRVVGDRVRLGWGNRILDAPRGSLIARTGGEVWSALRHLKRGGFPFGPVVRVDRPGNPDSFAIFNIEIHPNGVLSPLDQPESDAWDTDFRSIRTHLVLLGFSEIGPGLWCHRLAWKRGWIHLETGTGSRISRITVALTDQPAAIIGNTGGHTHAGLCQRLIDLLRATRPPNPSPDATSLLPRIFPAPFEVTFQSSL